MLDNSDESRFCSWCRGGDERVARKPRICALWRRLFPALSALETRNDVLLVLHHRNKAAAYRVTATTRRRRSLRAESCYGRLLDSVLVLSTLKERSSSKQYLADHPYKLRWVNLARQKSWEGWCRVDAFPYFSPLWASTLVKPCIRVRSNYPNWKVSTLGCVSASADRVRWLPASRRSPAANPTSTLRPAMARRRKTCESNNSKQEDLTHH